MGTKLILLGVLWIGVMAGCSEESSLTTPSIEEKLTWVSGKNNYTVEHDNVDRKFIVHVPSNYDGSQSVPLVYMIHGTTGNGANTWSISGWKEKAEEEGFIAVFPTSWSYEIVDLNEVQTKWIESEWHIFIKNPAEIKDDVGFIKKIHRHLLNTFNIDETRVYATGFSNGGRFVNTRLLVEMSDVFAAVATASGMLRKTHQVQNEFIPAATILGTKDGKLGAFTPLPLPLNHEDIMNHSLFRDSLLFGMHSTLQLTDNYNLEEESWQTTMHFNTPTGENSSENSFTFTIIKDMGHIYPNGENHPLIAANYFWNFFKAHHK